MKNQKFILFTFSLTLFSCGSLKVNQSAEERLPASQNNIESELSSDVVGRDIAKDKDPKVNSEAKIKNAIRTLNLYLHHVYTGATLDGMGISLLRSFEKNETEEERGLDSAMVLSHYEIKNSVYLKGKVEINVSLYYLGHLEQEKGFFSNEQTKNVKFVMSENGAQWFVESPYMIEPTMNPEKAKQFLKDNNLSAQGL